jgi:hypothetical protein
MARFKVSTRILAIVSIGASLAFGGQEPPKKEAPAIRTIEVTPARVEAQVGQQIKFTAIARDAEGKAVDVKQLIWFAGPFDLAVADPAGNVTVFGPGEVEVGAAIPGGGVGRAKIIVKPQPVVSVEIAAPAGVLVVGGTLQLTPSARVANGNPRQDVSYAWSSSNPSVAAVDQTGLVTAIAPGKASIQASCEGVNKSVQIEVDNLKIQSLAVEPRSASARTGDVVHFKAIASGAKSAPVRWTLGGDGAAVYVDGAFVAERPGSYVVTAICGDKSASATVLVASRNVDREIEVIGRAPVKEFMAAEQWIWGNYAYLSTISDRVLVYDISDPAHPKLTDTVKVDARLVNDVSVTADGKIGVITREGASNRKNGIAFLDTSDPAHPKVLSEYTATVTGGVHSAFVNGHYVYLTDDATGSLRVIDFQDPKAPKEVARWQVENPLAKSIKNMMGEEMGGRYLHDVYVKDGLAYLAYWRDGLVILDVGSGIKGGSPESPKLVSQFRFNHNELYGDGWLAGTHAVFRYKNYVFLGDEVFPSEFNLFDKKRIPARGIVHVIDVSDINNPRKVAEYPVPEGGSHNMWVEDDIMVMGYYGAGGRVVDVSGELRGDLYRQGREIAHLWTGDPEAYRPNVPFCWGAQPHNGLIFFNDINSGLWITKLGNLKHKGSTTEPGS